MKIKYNDFHNTLVIDGKDILIIPNNKSKAVFNIDSDSLNIMIKKFGIYICFRNFHVKRDKPTIKEKFKMIFRILML